jgi:hypothetical protein
MLFKGRNPIQIKINVVFRPFHALSNGELLFAGSLILGTGKLIKLVTGTVLAFNLHFQHIELSLQENKVPHSKERQILV